jgi:two-component system, OmpR family, phosphate regulon sensor histidine kinase PhoR
MGRIDGAHIGDDTEAHYFAPHPAQRMRSASSGVHALVAILLSALTLGVGVAVLSLEPPGDGVASWWPAAGTGVLLALLFRGPLWVPLAVIGLTGLTANLAAGRGVDYALVALVVLTGEAAVMIRLLGRRGEHARLDSLQGLGRFFLAAAAGALSVTVLGSVSLWLLAGLPPVQTAIALFLSHLSALLITPAIALVPLTRRRLAVKPRRIAEGVVQFTVTVVVAAVIFAPILPAPLLFSLFPLLAWAAARFRPLYVVAQLTVMALLIPALSLLIDGPFRGLPTVTQPALIVQLFIISVAITALFLAVGRSEREALLDDRERRAALLRGGFIGAQVGFLIARRDERGTVRIIEANEVGRRMTSGDWLEPLIDAWLRDRAGDLTQEITLANGRSYQVYASVAGVRLSEDVDHDIVGIQLVEITDTIAARDALARTLERERAVTIELRELGRQKDVFVSAVSHELRTPITSILGFAEVIEDTGPPETKQAAEIIVRNSNRLASMVEQLLELGRVADPESHRQVGSADLDTVVRETVEEQARAAEKASITLDVDTGVGDREVMIERLSLGRVLTNLVSNALKFTPSGGTVHISTRVRGARAIVHVDDSGVGIDPADRPRVFERFFRSSDEAKLAAPGTGLGLPIVKALVESAGGSVAVKDSPLGGTRLAVELPLLPAREPQPTPAHPPDAPSRP